MQTPVQATVTVNNLPGTLVSAGSSQSPKEWGELDESKQNQC